MQNELKNIFDHVIKNIYNNVAYDDTKFSGSFIPFEYPKSKEYLLQLEAEHYTHFKGPVTHGFGMEIRTSLDCDFVFYKIEGGKYYNFVAYERLEELSLIYNSSIFEKIISAFVNPSEASFQWTEIVEYSNQQ